MTPGRKWYVAVLHGRTAQGRRNWRLYRVHSDSIVSDATPLGDYDRLRKIRDQLATGGKRVEALRSARTQVAFHVSKGDA